MCEVVVVNLTGTSGVRPQNLAGLQLQSAIL